MMRSIPVRIAAVALLLLGVAIVVRTGMRPDPFGVSGRKLPIEPASGDSKGNSGSARTPYVPPPPLPQVVPPGAPADWAFGPSIEANAFLRRLRVNHTASVVLDWAYTDEIANNVGSLAVFSPSAPGQMSEPWIRETYAGRIFDQLFGGSVRDSATGSVEWICPGFAGAKRKGTIQGWSGTVLRKEMLPLSLWLRASVRNSSKIEIPVRDFAERLRSGLQLAAYQPRPGQTFPPRSQAPEKVRVQGGESENPERIWVPEAGGPAVWFDRCDLIRVRIGGLFPSNVEGQEGARNLHEHAVIPAERVEAPIQKAGGADFALYIRLDLEVDWDRLQEFPTLVALQAFLDIGSLQLPGLTGTAVPDPKEILLARTSGDRDVYQAMMTLAEHASLTGDLHEERAVYEAILTRFPSALIVYQWLERTYWKEPALQTQLEICRRALAACENPDLDSTVLWTDVELNAPRNLRLQRARALTAPQIRAWKEREQTLRK